jgi:hypothetical protein
LTGKHRFKETMMKTGYSRRTILRGIGHSAALGTLAASLPRSLLAAEQAKPAICLTMLYPSGEGLAFDADDYRDRHMGLLRDAYGEGVERIELRVPPPVPPPEPPAPAAEGEAPPPAPPPTPPFLAAVNMWIGDFKKFADGANSHATTVNESMAKITRSAPIAQFDSVISSFGAQRDEVLSETRCLGYLLQAKEGVKWDSNSYANTFLPKFFAAFGPEAIKRIEVMEGIQSANGKAALMMGAVNFYIADQDKFLEVGQTDAVKQVVAEEVKYFAKAPIIRTVMQVYSVG